MGQECAGIEKGEVALEVILLEGVKKVSRGKGVYALGPLTVAP